MADLIPKSSVKSFLCSALELLENKQRDLVNEIYHISKDKITNPQRLQVWLRAKKILLDKVLPDQHSITVTAPPIIEGDEMLLEAIQKAIEKITEKEP